MLSVVIATKDRAPFLAHTLTSLSSQLNAPPFEVIAVDNGSSDGTGELLDELRAHVPFPLVRLFVAEPNRAKARNAGIEAAGGETIVFVDDDVWLPHEFLAGACVGATRGRRLCQRADPQRRFVR
jgi:glycosyltransferase involved in cell wall biosynthesis